MSGGGAVFTADDVTALKRAIATGVLKVRHGEDEITYRSIADMERALRFMENELCPGKNRRSNRAYAVTSKNL